MKEEIENELRDISPFLADLKNTQPDTRGKGQPFKTPKFYFDTLADRVMEKTQLAAPSQYKAKKSVFSLVGKWISTLLQPRWAMAMASVAILVVASWFYWGKLTIQVEQPLTEISNEDINEYINNNLDDFDENLLAESDLYNSNTEEGGIFKDMPDNEVEQYLKDNIEEHDLENDEL
jgi:hypothetical protein